MGKVYTYIQPTSVGGVDKDYVDTELEKKLDKDGHVLTDNNYSNEDKNKLSGLKNYVHPNDANTRHVTDVEKSLWNGKANGDHTHQDLMDLINALSERITALENPESEI